MLQNKLKSFVDHPYFETVILALIIINAVVLGLETSPAVMNSVGPALMAIDTAILAVFVIELFLRLVADFRGFWRNPWRIFDLVVVGVAVIPSTGAFSVLRAFRILRVLRLVSTVKAMRRVVTGLLSALPGMGSIVLLLGLIFYVFAVISTKLFGNSFPDWFGTLGESAYTLFQIMTLESWSMGIVRPVMEQYPYAWLLFVPFIIMTAFTVLNLFIGVIVDAMQSEHEAEARGERERMMSETEMILNEVRALRQEVAELKSGKNG
ncbi:MAG: ion transporter [Rhizobiaceae bacterium]|nr:ion transporter [Rhizobiaceae bacterium]